MLQVYTWRHQPVVFMIQAGWLSMIIGLQTTLRAGGYSDLSSWFHAIKQLKCFQRTLIDFPMGINKEMFVVKNCCSQRDRLRKCRQSSKNRTRKTGQLETPCSHILEPHENYLFSPEILPIEGLKRSQCKVVCTYLHTCVSKDNQFFLLYFTISSFQINTK